MDGLALPSQTLTLPWPSPHRREVCQLLEGTDVQLMLQGRGVGITGMLWALGRQLAMPARHSSSLGLSPIVAFPAAMNMQLWPQQPGSESSMILKPCGWQISAVLAPSLFCPLGGGYSDLRSPLLGNPGPLEATLPHAVWWGYSQL